MSSFWLTGLLLGLGPGRSRAPGRGPPLLLAWLQGFVWSDFWLQRLVWVIRPPPGCQGFQLCLSGTGPGLVEGPVVVVITGTGSSSSFVVRTTRAPPPHQAGPGPAQVRRQVRSSVRPSGSGSGAAGNSCCWVRSAFFFFLLLLGSGQGSGCQVKLVVKLVRSGVRRRRQWVRVRVVQVRQTVFLAGLGFFFQGFRVFPGWTRLIRTGSVKPVVSYRFLFWVPSSCLTGTRLTDSSRQLRPRPGSSVRTGPGLSSSVFVSGSGQGRRLVVPRVRAVGLLSFQTSGVPSLSQTFGIC